LKGLLVFCPNSLKYFNPNFAIKINQIFREGTEFLTLWRGAGAVGPMGHLQWGKCYHTLKYLFLPKGVLIFGPSVPNF